MNDPHEDGGPRNTLYTQAPYTGRQMSRRRRLVYRSLAPVAAAIVRGWWWSCRIKRVIGAEHLEEALAKAPSFIPCCWHQHQLFCGKYLADQRPRVNPGWLVSPSVDGEIGAMLLREFGCPVIRGSSTHTGARALRDYYQALVKQDISPVITPDGPRGPRFKFKPGALLLSQMSGRPILPIAYAASRAWLVKWDKFVIPVPGSRIVIALGEPVTVPRVTDAAMLERLAVQMEQELHQLYRRAHEALG